MEIGEVMGNDGKKNAEKGRRGRGAKGMGRGRKRVEQGEVMGMMGRRRERRNEGEKRQ